MEKSPEAFRTISEVAEHLAIPAHVLRFWESRFPQIKPVKRAGGRRYYRPADVALLDGIKRLLHDEGMTIRGVQKVLRDQGIRHVAGLAGVAEPSVEETGLAVLMHDMEPAPRQPEPDAAEDMTVVVLAEALARTDRAPRAPVPLSMPVTATVETAPPAAPPVAAPMQPSLFDAAAPAADGPTLAARLRAMAAPADAQLAARLLPLRNRLATLRGRMGRAARPGLV